MRDLYQIESLRDKTLSAKTQDRNPDNTKRAKEIDKLVYSLYGLDSEEIEVIEKNKV